MRRLARVLALPALVLALPGPAHAAPGKYFAGETIDGPGADVQRLGDVDVARDGTGALAYVKRDAGVDHVFVSRLIEGTWQPPERLDAGLDAAAAQPVVAASGGGRLAVVFQNASGVFAAVRPEAGGAWTAPALLAAGATNPAVDMSINGVAYVTFTVPGTGGDVRAARLERTGTDFTVLDAPLDLDPARDAGRRRQPLARRGRGRRLGRRHVGRGRSRGRAPAVRVPAVRRAVGPDARRVRRRAGRAGRRPRRRHRGRLELRLGRLPPELRRGGAQRRAPARRLAVRGARGRRRRRAGRRAAPGPRRARRRLRELGVDDVGRRLLVGAQGRPLRRGRCCWAAASASVPSRPPWWPTTATAPSPTSRASPAARARCACAPTTTTPARARSPCPGRRSCSPIPALGPPDASRGLDAAANRAGDVSVAFVQGEGDGRRIVAAAFDRAPGAFGGYTTSRWRRFARPPLRWATSFELWGPLTYRVEIDGRAVATTSETSVTVPSVIRDGLHRWRVVATDRRGQSTATASRFLRVDATKPRVRLLRAPAWPRGHRARARERHRSRAARGPRASSTCASTGATARGAPRSPARGRPSPTATRARGGPRSASARPTTRATPPWSRGPCASGDRGPRSVTG